MTFGRSALTGTGLWLALSLASCGGGEPSVSLSRVDDVVLPEATDLRGLVFAANGKIYGSGFTDVVPDNRQTVVLRTNADTFFSFQDLAPIKQANEDMAAGATCRSVLRALLASRQGQLAFDFSLEASPAKIVTLPPRPPKTLPLDALVRATQTAEEYFRQASDLDDGNESTVEEAAALYRAALEHDPHLVAALINLANIHYTHQEVAEAQALYERAIALESDFYEAHFNLGNIHHDLGEFEKARACYDEALLLNPYYADSHFYMAVTLEKMGLSQEARPHWKSYMQLAPQGAWVELAREFSEDIANR